jgi:hypothetical protein
VRGQPYVPYVRWYTGKSLEYDLICPACAVEREAGHETRTADICVECRDWLVDEVGDLRGAKGRPGILERPERIEQSIDETHVPESFGAVVDVAAIGGEPSIWVALGEHGRLARVNLSTKEWTDVGWLEVATEPVSEPWSGRVLTPHLHVAHSGEFLAVVDDYGKRGAVFAMGESRPRALLDGGDYHQETVPFSFAFAEHQGRCVFIHRTDWNRLDVSDAVTGTVLTERGPTRYVRGEERPDHYLDYFHGRLAVSPNGRYIFDDGWVWHPVGIAIAFDLEKWLNANVWESEDGDSNRSLAARAYYWDHAMCWIGSDLVAVGGIGEDDDHIVDGARIFSMGEPVVANRQYRGRYAPERNTFAGPAGKFFSDGSRLFSSGESGLSVWDVSAGARISRIEGFRPSHQHPAGELIELRDSTLFRWSY